MCDFVDFVKVTMDIRAKRSGVFMGSMVERVGKRERERWRDRNKGRQRDRATIRKIVGLIFGFQRKEVTKKIRK